jgi:hypothetical protein
MRFHGDYLRADYRAYGSSGSGESTVTNKTDLPYWIQAAAQDNLAQAKQVSSQPYQAYTGQTVAGLTPDQQAAYGYVRDNLGTTADTIGQAASGITGSNLTTTAQGLLNPYLDQVESNAVGQVQRQGDLAQNDLAAKAASAGAFGGTRFGVQSGVLSAETARQAGDLSAQIRSQGWDTAVGTALTQAQQVAGLAGAAQTAGLTSASALSTAGAQEQNQQQAQLNALLQAWQDAQNYPLQQLAINQSALTSTPYGGTSTSTQPINKANPATGALSGAATGAALGTMAYPGIGTAIGAGVGALGGYLSSR